MADANKPSYAPPMIFDLGSTEGVGECLNGTGVFSCTLGYEDMDDCIGGRYAANSCGGGVRYYGPCVGGFEASRSEGDDPLRPQHHSL